MFGYLCHFPPYFTRRSFRILKNDCEGSLCDKTEFVKFKISNNFKQNINATHLKKIHIKIHSRQWILKIQRKKSANQKSQDVCQIFVISKKKARTSGKKPFHMMWIYKSLKNL